MGMKQLPLALPWDIVQSLVFHDLLPRMVRRCPSVEVSKIENLL